MINNSNLTNSEFYSLNGTLSDDRINAILDFEAMALPIIENLDDDISEIKANLPDEDFLSPISLRLESLIRSMRTSANKTELEDITLALSDLELYTYRNTEYALEKLDNLQKEVNNVN